MRMLFDTLYMFDQHPLQMALWKRSASPLKKHICKVNKCSWSQIRMNNKKVWVACKWPLQSISYLEHWGIFQRHSGPFRSVLYFQLFPWANYKRLALWFNRNFVITLSPLQFKLSLALSSCIRFWFKKTIAGFKRRVNTAMRHKPHGCAAFSNPLEQKEKALSRRSSAVMWWPHLDALDEILSLYT